jgi:hypothetical protein
MAALLGGAGSAILGVCGPFTDVSDAAFCPFVLEIFSLGITTGTTPTTYDPTAAVNRLQMAAFLSRSVDGVLRRGGRRAALNQFWRSEGNAALAVTTVGAAPQAIVSDGADLWVSNLTSQTVSRVRASDGKLLETWTGAPAAFATLSANGRVFVVGSSSPGGKLFRIDPSQPAGVVTTVATNLGDFPSGIAYDGSRIWTANNANSVSIVTPSAAIPWSVTTVTAGFGIMIAALYDGANIWVTRVIPAMPGTLLKLNSAGVILQTITVGLEPQNPVFDGANIWSPNGDSSSISVVRASNGAVLATLTGNGLNQPFAAAFDGQRILVTNLAIGENSVSLWKAADLTPLGVYNTGMRPLAACSDGVNFWITFSFDSKIARF